MPSPSLYARLLGRAFEQLAPGLQAIHDTRSPKLYVGRCEIRGGSHWLARIIARFAGLPMGNREVEAAITITTVGNTEIWLRKFGSHPMQSQLADRKGHLEERIGLIITKFTLTAERDRIVWSLHSARLAWLALPITWLLTCAATESVENGRYGFDVSAHVRGIGRIVHYKGWLVEHA